MLAALAVTLPPLVFLTALRDPFRLPKLLASESLALTSVALLCGGLALGWRGDLGSIARRPVLGVAAAVLVVATLGLVSSSHPAHVREALPSLWIAVVATVAWSLGIEQRTLRRLLDSLLLPASILAAIAIAQYHDVYQPFAFDASQIDPRIRITSLAGNVGDLAAYLVLPLLVGQVRVWEALRRRREPAVAPLRKKARAGARGRVALATAPGQGFDPLLWLAGIASLLCAYALAVTLTLTALAAVSVATLVLWLMLVERKRSFLLVIAMLAVVAALLLLAGPLRPRVVEKTAELRRGELNNVLTGRLDGWRAGLLMAREHPWSGVGHGAFRAEFAPAKLTLLDRGVPFFRRQLTSVFANAHNEAIEAAAEWGVPGFLALLAASWVLVRRAARIVAGRGAGISRGDGALACAGLASFAALAAASFPFRVAVTGYQAVLFAAWLLAADAIPPGASKGSSLPAALDRHSTTRRWRLAAATALAIAALAIFLHGRRAVHRIAASAQLQRVESMTALMIRSGRAVPQVLLANRRALLPLRLLDPSEPAIPITLGAQHFLLERFPEAVEWYQSALDLEPRPEAYFGRGRAQLRLGDQRAARDSFALAVKLSPHLAGEVPAGMSE